MATKEEAVYVGIENPAEVRRALLESSKSLIKILQKSEEIRKNKKHKHQLVLEFKETMRETAHLLSQLKSQMPKVRLSSLPRRHAPNAAAHAREANKPAKQIEQQKPRPAAITESQKLEKELQDIEEKLKRL